MKISRWSVLIVALLVMALPLVAACGDDDTEEPTRTQPPETTEPPKEDVKIKIGLLTDKSGPASQALIPVDAGLKDAVRYFEENDLIPGVKIEVIDYDTQYNPANVKPGYEKLKSEGADLFVSGVPAVGMTLKPVVDEDEKVLFSLTASENMYNPPGWVFSVNIPTEAFIYTLMAWIAENDWDYEANGPAKIGGAAWNLPYGEEQQLAARTYAEANPEQFDWVAGHLAEMSTTWDAAVESLKNCDYIIPPATGFATPQFMKKYDNAGYTTTYIGTDAQMAYYGLILDGAGWDIFDGTIMALPYTWWNEDAELVDKATYALENYHGSEEAENLKWSGGSYRGGFTQYYGVLTIIKEAVEAVGPENFDSQALYDAATSFSHDFDGNVWDYSATDRTTWQSLGIFMVNKDIQDIERVSDVWVPVHMTP